MSGVDHTEPIGILERYFGAGVIPTIAEQFIPGRGWQTCPGAERISLPALRALRAGGISAVALAHDGRIADFRVAELLAPSPAPVQRVVR